MAPSDRKRKKEQDDKNTMPVKKQTRKKTNVKSVEVEKTKKIGNRKTTNKSTTETGIKCKANKKASVIKTVPATKIIAVTKVGKVISTKVKKTEPNSKKVTASELSKTATGKEASKKSSQKSKPTTGKSKVMKKEIKKATKKTVVSGVAKKQVGESKTKPKLKDNTKAGNRKAVSTSTTETGAKYKAITKGKPAEKATATKRVAVKKTDTEKSAIAKKIKQTESYSNKAKTSEIKKLAAKPITRSKIEKKPVSKTKARLPASKAKPKALQNVAKGQSSIENLKQHARYQKQQTTKAAGVRSKTKRGSTSKSDPKSSQKVQQTKRTRKESSSSSGSDPEFDKKKDKGFLTAGGNRKRKKTSQTNPTGRKSRKISPCSEKENVSNATDKKMEDRPIQAYFVHEKDVFEPDDTTGCWITGIDVFPSGEMILVDMGNKKIKLYSESFTFLSAIPLDIDTIPQDISISCIDASCAYFTKPFKADGIQKISMVEGQISLRESFETTGRNRGIVCTTAGILTTVTDYLKINLHDYEGTLLQSLSTDQSGKALFTRPIYITVNNTGQQIIVGDCNSNAVVGVDSSGRIQFKVNITNPRGLTVDDEDNIYMAEIDDKNVSVVSPNGKQLQVLIDHREALEQGASFGLPKPYQLCYNRMNSQLLVSSESCSIITVFNIVKKH